MKRILSIAIPFALYIPLLTNAQLINPNDDFTDVAQIALNLLNLMMQTVFALVSLGIIWTTFKYVNALREGAADKAKEFRKILIGAVVGMAVVFTLWGIINLIANTLGWTDVGIPQFRAPSAS